VGAEREKTLRRDECNGKAHYWVLDDNNFGVCKKCGGKKQFPIDVWGWQNRKIKMGLARYRTIR